MFLRVRVTIIIRFRVRVMNRIVVRVSNFSFRIMVRVS